MRHKFSNTAVLVFSRSAKAESVEKSLFSSGRKNFNHIVYQSLLKQSLHTAEKSGLPVFWIDEKKQRGGDFGERLANAFQEVFDQGYENVISIGNDAPELSSNDLTQAANAVGRNRAILGPTKDGGDYLIGFNKKDFRKESFRNIPWRTNAVNQSLVAYFESLGCEVQCLETLVDVDNESAIWASSESQHNLQALKALLINLVQRIVVSLISPAPSVRPAFSFQKGLRAPPALS